MLGQHGGDGETSREGGYGAGQGRASEGKCKHTLEGIAGEIRFVDV